MRSQKRRHRKSYNEPGHAHELTFGCYRGYPLLARERSCQWLATAIDSARQELQFALWAFVFMPNHVHLIVYPHVKHYDISRILQRIKQPVSRKALAFLRKTRSVWLERLRTVRGQRVEYHFWQRGGGYDRNIIEPGTLHKMLD